MSGKIVVCLMLKAPREGFVKTRLAADLKDNGRATRIYRWLVENQIAAIPEVFKVSVWFAPRDAGSEMHEWLGNRASYHPQPHDGDLGVRLAAAMEFELQHGAQQVLFVGGDCPTLNGPRLLAASEALATQDLVIYPASDGGYCLIGLRKNCPEIFCGISWSTSEVFEQTLQAAKRLELTTRVLETLEDVDDEESLARSGLDSLHFH